MIRYIKFRISGGETGADGRTTRASVKQLESNVEPGSVNDLTRILHSLAGAGNVIKENNGFPYTLPFELS